MQAPISLLIRNGLRTRTRKLVGASLATLVAVVILCDLAKRAPSFAPVDERIFSADRGPAGEETSDATADFLEGVALSHVASLKAAAPGQATVVAAGAPPAFAVFPLPPRRPTASQDHPHASKERVAVNAPIGPSPAQQPPAATSESAVVPAPVAAERFNPLQYGTRLVASFGDIVAASDKRVVEGVGSVSDALASLVKKL